MHKIILRIKSSHKKIIFSSFFGLERVWCSEKIATIRANVATYSRSLVNDWYKYLLDNTKK